MIAILIDAFVKSTVVLLLAAADAALMALARGATTSRLGARLWRCPRVAARVRAASELAACRLAPSGRARLIRQSARSPAWTGGAGGAPRADRAGTKLPVF